MSKLIFCQFNIDTACVELVFVERSQISIDFTAVENEVADNRFQRSELDYLIYNDPLASAVPCPRSSRPPDIRHFPWYPHTHASFTGHIRGLSGHFLLVRFLRHIFLPGRAAARQL